MRKQVVTHPGSSCWFQMGRYFPASPPWGRWWFLCFGPGILSLRVGLRPHPVSASFHCHGDQGRPRAIRRCPADIWAGLDCSPHRRCCRRRREDPAKSSQSIRQWRVRVSLPALPPKDEWSQLRQKSQMHCDCVRGHWVCIQLWTRQENGCDLARKPKNCIPVWHSLLIALKLLMFNTFQRSFLMFIWGENHHTFANELVMPT